MVRSSGLALVATIVLAASAHADPIEGNWRTADGPTAAIGKCGGSFCVVMKTGNFVGKQIGKFRPSGDNQYTGTLTDPKDDKTYSGSATLSGPSLSLTGCALKIFCKTQKWSKS
jgi:uncharacterized protein (DUF2147 family)